MSCGSNTPCGGNSGGCPSEDGCPAGVCPDFTIRRHDTRPSFKVAVTDCDGPLDLTDENLAVEASIWAKGKLKTAMTSDSVTFSLADNIGFSQIMVGDIIVMDRTRLPEYMLVKAFDEENYVVGVQRGYNSTTASAWKKGTKLKIFRTLSGTASIETVLEDIPQIDGSTLRDQIMDTFLVYDWQPEDTCTPGCYWLEFKLMKLVEEEEEAPLHMSSFTPSSYTPDDFSCGLPDGVEWIRRFPVDRDGFLIKITDTT
jgi:hypothetical protein